ncbi:MAG TPA: hypothetical protein VN256_19410 [Pyrinomonadaceae bacterium]|nr:hypothetical protein [Pyrinomonadaceae bacterium]
MYDKLYRFLVEMATWPRVVLLVALSLLIMGGFELRMKELGYANTSPDTRWRGYSSEDVRKFFHDIGKDGRRLYAGTQRTLDVAFPLVYGSLFASLIILLYGPRGARYLVLAPVSAAVMDLAENAVLSHLALRFEEGSPPPVKAASIFTMLKWALCVISLGLIIVGVWAAWRRRRDEG